MGKILLKQGSEGIQRSAREAGDNVADKGLRPRSGRRHKARLDAAGSFADR